MNGKLARGVAIGLVSGLAAAAVAEALRPRGGSGRLLDWDEIARFSRSGLAGPNSARLPAPRLHELAAEYGRLASAVEGPLLHAVGSLPGAPVMPPFEALDREGWVELNIGILRRAIDPLLARPIPNTRLTDLGRAGADRYVGTLLGFLSRRVLGQFDPQLLGREPVVEPRLYLVETNIKAWQEEADLPRESLLRWLILHEMTHAWQFAAHPWLREHMNSSLENLLALAAGASAGPWTRLVGLTTGLPGQWVQLRRMQATMTLVEGYSNLVMNLVGRRLLPDFERLEDAYRRRRGRRGGLEILFWKLTGLDLKLQQYERGERFCQAVFDAHGMDVLNIAWTGPENVPRPEEMERPEAWVRRVNRGRLLPSPA